MQSVGKSVVRFDGNGDVLNVSSIRTAAGAYSVYAITQRISEVGDTNGHLASEPTWALIPSSPADSFSAQVAKNSASSGASLTNIKLGKSGSSTSNDYGGDLAELLIFSRQLSSSEEQKVEGYLAHKWGVANTLDSNHTYKDVPPIFDNGPVITPQYYFTGETPQEVIKVDFGQNDPAPLQAGYVGFNPWGSTSVDNGNSVVQTYVNSYASNNSLKLSVQGQSHWRDYNSILQQPHDLLSNLLSDEVLSNAGGTIIITLNGLKTGQYSISTYHHASEGNGNNTYNLKATDASGANRLVASSMTSSGGRYPSSINKKTFDLLSNGKNEVQVLVGPGGSSGNHLVVNGFDLSQQNYKVIQTGENVSMQVPATRNPTSWTASGLATGLTINNSGVISGTTTFIGDFNATVTAINADGNDSKVIQFRSIKGQRIITWDQNFTNITYGDAPITLNATATGTGDLNYTSSDSDIIEINGTSAIIRGGGSVTLTATAVENTTAFAAIPVTKIISVAKAPLTITGQDLTLPVGTSIPDLNYTATGWKHNDASLGVAANPAAFSNLALWLDAADSSTLFSDHTFNTSATTDIGGWKDKSGNNNHATQATSSRKPTYTVSNSLLNNKSSVSSSSENGSIGLDLPSTSLQEIFVVAYYKDGSDNSFDNYNTLISGTGTNGQYRIMGHSGSSNWFTGSDRLNDGGNFKNGATSSSNSALPMSATLLRFASSVARTQTRGILYNTQNADRGWIGGVGQIIGLSTTSSTSDRQKIEGYLAHKWGLAGSLPSNHSHKTVSLTRGPVVTTNVTNSSSAGTYYIRPGAAASSKYSFTYADGDLVLSSLTAQTIAWDQNFSEVGVGQTVDLNASATSNLSVIYSVSDPSVAELAVTNQSSLHAWYKLDETGGVDAIDSSVYGSSAGHKGSLRNATGTPWNSGKFANAITLDGSNDHIRDYNFQGITGNARRTIALWFKTSTANKPLIQYGASGSGTLFKLSLNGSGAAVLDLGGTTLTTSTTGLANGAWHHVAATIPANGNTGGAKLYINGTVTNGSGSTAINTATTADLVIGRDGTSGSAYFNGQIDDVRLYGAELNATLISQLYGNGNGDFNRLTVKSAGTVTITATQPGNNSYAQAPSSSITATFDKSDQTIAFTPITDKSVGDFDFSPTAVASSGLGVSFASSNNLIAEVQGTAPNQTIKIRAAGTATITASQVGNGAYNAAPSVTQTVTVGYFNLQANSLPGIRLWLDGNNLDADNLSDTTHNGSNLTDGLPISGPWKDRSGNTNHASQATANNRPTYGLNGLNAKGVINFTTGQSLDISNDANIRSIVAVIKQASSQSAITKPFGGNQNLTTSAQKFALGAADSGISTTSYHVVVWQFASGAYSIYIDGVNKGTSSSSLTPDAFDKVGNDFAGSIAEVVAYDRGLSDGVRQKLEGYLAHKWGLKNELISTHTYKNSSPAFGGVQALTFQPISDKQVGQTATLDVSSDSGLTTFTFDSNDSSVVSFYGNVATALKVGKVTINATQPGQTPWISATASQTLIVTTTPRADQTITFADIPSKTVQSASFDLSASASSGLPVSFESLHTNVATVDANGTVTIVGQGDATIRATQDGNGSYNPAPSVSKVLSVTKVPQTITFAALTNASLNAGTYSLAGKASASSGLSLTYASSDSTIASISGDTLNLHSGGTVTITASQGGNDYYLAAPDATQLLTIIDDTQQQQTITWSQVIPALTAGDADLNLTASASSGLAVSYVSSDETVVKIVNSTYLQVVGSGTATITATQPGGGQYAAATPVLKTATVSKANQTIVTSTGGTTLPDLTKDNGDFPFAPAVKSVDGSGADTGLSLTYSSSNTAVIDVNGIKLEPKGVGNATITVSQVGDTNYNAASSKTFTVTVTQRTPYTDSFSGLQLWLNGKDVNGDGLADSSSDFLSGNKASSWADRSGNSNTLTQGTSANQPIWVPAGGLTFDGNDFLSKATLPSDLAGNSGLTLLVVAESSATTSQGLLNLGALSGNVDRLALTTSGSFLYQNGSTAIAQNGSYNLNTAKSVAVFKRPANGNFDQGTYFLNGTSKGITLSGAADASGFSIPTSAPLTLGKASGGIAGKIYEVMLYDNKLAEYSRKRLEGYLAHKWGGASNLPSGHPFKSNAPEFGGSQSIVTNAHTIPVVSSSPTLSFDIGLFTLEDYGIYADSGLPLSYATSNANVVAVDSATGKLDPKGAGTATITLSQAGDTHFSAASNVTFSLTITQNRSQNITFAPIPDCNTSVSSVSLSASASSGLAVSFASSDTDVATVSGSTVTIVGPGTVTITASQAGGTDPSNSNITYSAAASVSQDFTVISIGDPLTLIFDTIGTMGTGQTFKVRAVLMNATTGKPVYMPKYLATGGSVTYSKTAQTGGGGSISGTSVTTGSTTGSITIKAYATGGGFETKHTSITVQVDGSKTGQKILVREGGDSGGLRDLPISRRPIGIGQMFSSTSNLAVSYSVPNNAPVKLVGTGKDAKLVFKTSKDGFSKNDLKGKFTGDTLTFDLTVTQSGNGSFHAAESVTRTIKLMKPTKSLFFEERKADARYDDMKTKAMNRMPAGVSGEKATALFDSDKYDSDGDGVSNLLERAFGGDSLGNDSRGARPAPVKTNDGKEYLSFTRYDSDYQATMGVQYIVEKSTDRRTWSSSGIEQVGSAVDLGGGMERVVYRTTAATSAGTTQFIRVRVKAR